MSIYLDHNATAPIRPEAAEAILRALQIGGNPSSVHSAGRAARALIEDARLKVAALVGAPAPSVIFTSGGAEANTLVIDSAILAGSRRLIIGATEHSSVQAAAEASGAVLEIWPVSRDGVADLAWLQARLASWDPADGPAFAALMFANNETGVLQPVAQAAALIRAAGGWLHVDAIQGFGKVAIDFRTLGADSLSLSAHKIGGPQGVGALAFGARAKISRRIHGGGQERYMRAGTENVPGIAGFGAAAAAALRGLAEPADTAARDAAARRLAEVGSLIVGEGAARLPGTLCIATRGFGSELQLMQMDLAGVLVSAGSACSSGKVKASHVLVAMGLDDLAACAIRVSGGWNTTPADWTGFADAWLAAYTRHTERRGALLAQGA